MALKATSNKSKSSVISQSGKPPNGKPPVTNNSGNPPNGKPPKYILGGEGFQNWEQVITKIRTILHKGARVLNGSELAFALDLLEYHPNKDKKKIDGIKNIKVGVPEFGSWFCFIIVDLNGNEQDFSYKKCTPTGAKNATKAKDSISKTTRLKCYREAIQPQISDYWENTANKQCSCCKSRFKIQVDHKEPSFALLVNNFEQQHQPQEYPKFERCDNVQTVRFSRSTNKNMRFIAAWQEFHQANAVYQLLCATCNLQKQDGVRYKPYLE